MRCASGSRGWNAASGTRHRSARREAAAIILDGVRSGAWRILVGEDAKMIDAAVRAKPEATYDYAELFSEMTPAPAAGTAGSSGNATGGALRARAGTRPGRSPAGRLSMRRFIMTGAPGSGKTSILRALENLGYAVVEEAATDVIAAHQAQGNREPWGDPPFIDAIVQLQSHRQHERVREGRDGASA